MSRIDNTGGAGGSRPINNPEPTEGIKETKSTSESTGAGSTAAQSPPTLSKPVVPDKTAMADMRAAGNRLKTELNKELDIKKPVDADQEKELASRLAQNMPRFAPPYVPVGPVVMGDNIGVPAQKPAGMSELNLRPDQFQINDQGNLVITNQNLIDFFKSLKEGGEDVRLGFMKLMKPPGEE